MCVYICIVVCRCVYVRVCADQSRLIVVWVTDPKPFPLTASSLFDTVQLEKKKVTLGPGEFLPHSDASMVQWGNAGQQSGLATGLLPHSRLWEQEGIMGDWSDRRWREVLTDSSLIRQRPGGASRFFLGRLWFRVLQPEWLAHSDSPAHIFISQEIKVRKRGKCSQYHEWFLKRLLQHQKRMLSGRWEVFPPSNLPPVTISLSHTHRDASTHVYIHIHKIQE